MQHGMCAWVQQFVKLVAVGEVLLSNDFHGLLLVYFLPSEKNVLSGHVQPCTKMQVRTTYCTAHVHIFSTPRF